MRTERRHNKNLYIAGTDKTTCMLFPYPRSFTVDQKELKVTQRLASEMRVLLSMYYTKLAHGYERGNIFEN